MYYYFSKFENVYNNIIYAVKFSSDLIIKKILTTEKIQLIIYLFLFFVEAVLKLIPPPLAPNVNLLCRELVDLLKTTDKCQILLSKFIPAYHHHFGRQCRVADYGYTKLLDLFESIPHVAQVSTIDLKAIDVVKIMFGYFVFVPKRDANV